LVATNSRHTAERLKRAYDVESVVCPPGVEVAAPGGGRRSPFVLSVGEIEPRKGFDFLIDALGCLGLSTRPPLRILANRSNPTELSRLRKRAQGAGVDLEVRIAPRSDVLEWHYANARLFVYAAHSEPLGLAPLEAMAHGTPVVAVAEGGVCDTVRSGVTGYLVERDPHAFAECVKRLWDDPTTLEVMRGAARAEVIERWDVTLRSERLEALLLSTARAEVSTA
jgi:glycosyltransferase involved in cell wall biosynthesis